MKNLWILFLMILLTLAGCKPSRPSDVMSESQMEKVLVDYHLAQGMAELSDKTEDVDRYRYIQAVFRKHRITEADFDSSLVYYSTNSEKLKEIYKRVYLKIRVQAERMGVDASATQNKFAGLTAQGDTANIWTDKNFATLLPDRQRNIYQFHVRADSSFRKGDAFIWHFQSQSIQQRGTLEAHAQLILTYESDTVVSRTYTVRGTAEYDLRFEPSDDLDTVPIRSVSGFVYLPLTEKDKETFHLLLLTDLSLIRMHTKVEDTTFLSTDSVQKDSIRTDSIRVDSLQPDSIKIPSVRLTPTQKRDNQPREQKINVRKEGVPSRFKVGQPMKRSAEVQRRKL